MGRALLRRETAVDVVQTDTMTNGCLPPTWCCSLLPISCELRFLWIELFDMILRSHNMQPVHYLVSKCSFQRKWWHAQTHTSSTKQITERESFSHKTRGHRNSHAIHFVLGQKNGSAPSRLLAASSGWWRRDRRPPMPRWTLAEGRHGTQRSSCLASATRFPRARQTTQHERSHLRISAAKCLVHVNCDGRCCWGRSWQEEARRQRATYEHASRTTVFGWCRPTSSERSARKSKAQIWNRPRGAGNP